MPQRRASAKPARRSGAGGAAASAQEACPPSTPDSSRVSLGKPACALATPAAAPDCSAEAQPPPSGPPKLTRPGYSTRPSAEALAALPDSALAALSGFAVCRKNYGEIAWEGCVDVRGVDLDAVVIIRRAGVDVYPRGCGLTPPVGCGLNRPAEVSLAERGVLAAAAREQPQAAQTGVVQLRLQRRSAAGQRRVWTYAVPLAGGQATLLATEGSDEDDLLEGSTAAHQAAPREDAMQLDEGAAACAERPAAAEEEAEAEEAQEAVALQLAPPRSSLDDVDD